MKNLILILLFAPITSSFGLDLKVGDSVKLPAPNSAKVHIGSKKTLAAIDQGDHVLILAKKPGESSVHIGDKSYRIRVLEASQSEFFSELEELLSKRMGLKAIWSQNQIQITGNLYVFKDWLEISNLALRKNSEYQFLAKPTPDVLAEAGEYFQAQAKLLEIESFKINESFPLKIHIRTKNEASFKRSSQFFKSFGIEVERTTRLVEIKPLIKTSVILAEVSKQASHSFGVQFPAQEEVQLLPDFKGPQSLMVALKALESKGLGKVLASPTLNCRSGAEAEFHAGGEFPIRLTGFRRQAVEWKKHGVVLKVKPEADSLGAIKLSIDSEISLIDNSQLVDGLPALKINRVSSHFDLKESNTIALSGLIQESWSRGQSGLFGLSQIPVLGALFRSHDFLNYKSELIIFVTPEVVDTETQGVIEWPKDWMRDEL